MACRSPMTLRDDHGYVFQVACGNCRWCRVRRKRSWSGRLQMEALDHLTTEFWTLTYADDPGELDYRDMQLFLKRLRYRFGNYRYFVVGEYGEKSGRGHWHMIRYTDQAPYIGHGMIEDWSHGFVKVGVAERSAINYVCGYVLKTSVGAYRPFIRMSLRPSIGFNRLFALGVEYARVSDGARATFPSDYYFRGKYYPLLDGAKTAFLAGFEHSGGILRDVSPAIISSQRYVSHMVSLVDDGSRMRLRNLGWAEMEQDARDGTRASASF